MSETVVKKSFMDKFTGFFYKFGHYMLMIIAYLATIVLAIGSGLIAGLGGFNFSDSTLLPWCVAFIVSIVLIGLSLIFSFVRPLRKFANYFFAAIGFIAVLLLGAISGWMFFDKQGGDFNGADFKISVSGKEYPIPAAASGGIFIVACVLIGLVIFGGIAYAISMADNRKKEKALKRAQEA